MPDAFKNLVLRFLRVPPEPEAPVGSPGSVRTFRAAPNYYKLKLFLWGFQQLAGLVGIIIFLTAWHSAGKGIPRQAYQLVNAFEIIGIITFLVQIPFTYAMVRLDYELRWYIVTDRSLRIRAGLWQVREITMTFANIQHITVHQGPLQRLLGIYDLEVSSAGGGGPAQHGHHGGGTADTHRGFFHGIANAPEVRDMMLERLRRLRDTGLGDPDERHPIETGEPRLESPVTDAARELLAEAKALRQTFA